MPDFAVFSRNYGSYLDEATHRGKDEWTTFRSSVRWAAARNTVKAAGQCRIYFAVIDGDGTVDYEAELVRVQIGPSLPDVETQRLLSHALKSTRNEKLWDKNKVKTLYVISNCRKIAKPFPQTKLRKLSNNQPLDKNYIRGYALVHPL
jgi:hypothetical protein